MRGHALAQKFSDRLFDLFGDASVSWDAARAIGEIARQDKILTKKNHAVIKVRWKSKGLDILCLSFDASSSSLRNALRITCCRK